MTETEFNTQVDAVLERIERALEDCDVDLDFESSGGILEIDFANGSKIIVNRQTFTREIWVAARAGGFHFGWRDGAWRNTRDGRELFEVLSESASQQAGDTVRIA